MRAPTGDAQRVEIMKTISAIALAVVLTAATPIFSPPVTPISGTAIAGESLLRVHCGVSFRSSKKLITKKETNVSDGDRHNGACWQYRHVAGRWKRMYVCY